MYKNQIYLFTISFGYRNSVRKVKVMPSEDYGSDHRLVLMRVNIKLKKLQKIKHYLGLNFDALRNREIQSHYQEEVLSKKLQINM